MGKGILIIVIIVAIIFLVMIQQRGWTGVKSNPFQSTWDASKTIADTGKDAFNKGKEIIDNFKNNENKTSNLVEVGQIPCSNDNQCNELLVNTCGGICKCINSTCFKQS